jgi:hypothetical protein
MVARRGSPEYAGASMNAQQPHPRATIKVAPTESSVGAYWELFRNLQAC